MTTSLRLVWLVCCSIGAVSLGAVSLAAGKPLEKSEATPGDDGTLWYDLRKVDVEGQGFSQTKAPYDRLPAKAEGTVRDAVWSLSRHSAGLCARFVTDSPTIRARWRLTSPRLAMPHMPATGVSGLDLYVRHEDRWRWLAVGQPTQQENTVTLASGLPEGRREYLLYLPLYNGVSKVELGIPSSHDLAAAPERTRKKPIVFYGTSITQGGCASRPGMVHTAILGRWLECPVVNLGFSGNGRMEPELARLMAEIDAAVYVIDCLPNLSPGQVAERTEPLVKILREARPQIPILLVEDRNYTDAFLRSDRRQRNEGNQAALRAAYQRLLAAGVENLAYLPGADLLGADGEAAVDGSHPTDLGFHRQAQAFEPALRPLLKEASQ